MHRDLKLENLLLATPDDMTKASQCMGSFLTSFPKLASVWLRQYRRIDQHAETDAAYVHLQLLKPRCLALELLSRHLITQ